jgi:hypothetical protein
MSDRPSQEAVESVAGARSPKAGSGMPSAPAPANLLAVIPHPHPSTDIPHLLLVLDFDA